MNMNETWIIPCNIKHFDVNEHFKNSSTVVWRNAFTIKPNDYVYIYIGAPLSKVMYKCVVLETAVDEKLLEENKYAIVENQSHNYFSKKIKYVEMKLIGIIKDDFLMLEKLKENGLGQVQIQARAPRTLIPFLNEADKYHMEVVDNGNKSK